MRITWSEPHFEKSVLAKEIGNERGGRKLDAGEEHGSFTSHSSVSFTAKKPEQRFKLSFPVAYRDRREVANAEPVRQLHHLET